MTPEEIAAGRVEMEALRTRNNEALKALLAQGVQFGPDVITQVRIIALIDELFGPGDGETMTEQRLSYENRCQKAFHDLVGQAQKQVREAILTAGVPAKHVGGIRGPLNGSGGVRRST